MDNITHSLLGLTLARAGFNRIVPHAVTILLLSSNAPDIDIVAASQGALRYFETHRGYTHSFLALPLVAAVSVLVTAAIFRQRLPWLKAWGLACIGVAGHLLLDWSNSYGVRPLIPFSPQWFHLDLNNLFDFVIWIALAAALLWPLFAALVSSEIGARSSRGRLSAVVGLSFCLLFDAGRALLHHAATEQLSSRLYDGAVPLSVAALPEAANPFHWTGIVETAGTYRVLDVNTLRDLDPQSVRIFYKHPLTWAIEAAKKTEPFQYFSYFARFPVWSEEPVESRGDDERRVELTDLRFGSPGAGSFHCIAVVRSPGQVLEALFTFGPNSSVGRGQPDSR